MKSLIFILLINLFAITEQPKKIRIFLAGDSTVCDYEPSRAPLTGWGTPFRNFFDSGVVISNYAKGGRSTRTFISEGRWKQLIDSVQAGDYVFIQFGHNDEATGEKYKDRYTPVPDYKANLERFVKEVKAKKALPVLITPVTRMRFDSAGTQVETHEPYSEACRKVAAALHIALIDLDKKSRDLLQTLGPEGARLLFMQLEPGEHPAYPLGQKDNTHFNDYGARRVAELVLQGLRELDLPIASHIVKPVAK